MRVLILGASGEIGRHVRHQARAAGHELVLFARDPAGLEPLASGEIAIAGDIGDQQALTAAASGVDAVISVLGPSSNSPDQVALFQNFAHTLVSAMHKHRVRRLVTISGAGVTLPGERKGLRARLASAVVRRLVPHVVAAKQCELEIVLESDLDWIAPRPPRVADGELTGNYRVGAAAGGMRITRPDLAHFMVKSLTDDTYLRQAPLVSS